MTIKVEQMIKDKQTRTLELPDGKRTTIRFDSATWRAVELVAERQDKRWTQWVREQIAAHPGAQNMHAAIRSAAIDELMGESIVAERAASGRGSVLLEGCTLLNDQQLADELAQAHVEGGPLEFVAFDLFAGLDQHNAPTIWVRNGLRDGMHAAITLAFTHAEVEAKRGAFV